MDRLIQLIALLAKQYPGTRLGKMLIDLTATSTDLLHIPNMELELLVTNALREGLVPRSRRVVFPIGLPGSGKSTMVKELSFRERSDGKRVVICSTDDFFMVNGSYKFNPSKLTEYHARNFQKFALALADAADLVILDNTNLRAEHRETYVRLAKAMGYTVEYRVVGGFTEEECMVYAGRNVHGVPLDGIRRMASSVQLPEEG